MELDNDKLDAPALATLSLTLHDVRRVWKGIDWAVTYRPRKRPDPRSDRLGEIPCFD